MNSKRRILGWGVMLVLALAGSANGKSRTGSLSGVVLDPSGTPQMGAVVLLIAENGAGESVSQLLTNQHGAFFSDLKPGTYSVRVSMAGFLPTLEHHVAVVADLTTLLRVQVETVFASLDRLRRNPQAQTESDDWKWVLRSSAATRTILQWRDGNTQAASSVSNSDVPLNQRPRGLVQMSNGSLNSRSVSDLADSPATTFSYDQSLGAGGRLLIAGQINYDGGPSGGIASIWLPSGVLGRGPETTFVSRREAIGIHGLSYQGMRFDHTEEIALGNRMSLRAGAEYLHVGTRYSVSSLRPHVQIDAILAPTWTATFSVAASPTALQLGEPNALRSAIAELDSLPTLLFDGGRPVLPSDWHQELSVNHKLSDRSSVQVAAFYDAAQHQAIFGSGTVADSDFSANPFPRLFRYDAGGSDSWGARLAYRRKLSDGLEFAAVYSWAGDLSPDRDLNPNATILRDNLETRYHHSVAARISGKLPHAGTQFAASYQWISGTVLTRQDTFGDAAYQLDPNLHITVRQPIPGSCLGGHWEALADFSNVLAQGYVPLGTGQGSKALVIPISRSFRGGVSFQF